MLRCFPIYAVFLFLEGGLVSSHVYHYRVTQLYTNLLNNMGGAFPQKVVGLSKIVQQQGQFQRSLHLYDLAIKSAEGTTCANPDNMINLQMFKDSLRVTRTVCLPEPDCENELPTKAESVIESIQQIDEDTKKEETECENEECKFQVYLNRDDKLVKLYEDTIPAIRVAADRIVADAKCSTALLECMDIKNAKAVKQMTTYITQLEECVKNAHS